MEIEDDDIDFNLLRTLLAKRKQIERNEVSRLLGLDDAQDVGVLDDLMLLLEKSGCRRYLSLKTLTRHNVEKFLAKRAEDSNYEYFPLALQAFDRFHEILGKEIPPKFLPGGEEQNLVDELESLTLTRGPSGVKLSDPESTVAKGLVVDFSLSKAPLTVPAHATGTELMNFCVRSGITDLSRLLTEGSYTMRDIGYPLSMVAKSADSVAKTVLPENYGRRRKWVVADPQSKPELAAGIRTEGQGHPTKSDEWKSFPSEAIEELVQTSLGHIQSSYFREEQGGQSWRFYESAPWGLAFLSSACSTVCAFSVEMIGVLHFSIYGGGCSVGTKMYNEYIAVLDQGEEQRVIVDLARTPMTSCQTVGNKVQRVTDPVDQYFYKVIRYDLFRKDSCPEHGIRRGENWRRLFHVYKRYGRICNDGDLPRALVPASLLYGEFQVSQTATNSLHSRFRVRPQG